VALKEATIVLSLIAIPNATTYAAGTVSKVVVSNAGEALAIAGITIIPSKQR